MDNLKLSFTIIIAAFLLLSCEEKADDPVKQKSLVLLAGDTVHPSLAYQKYYPPLLVKGLRVGTDSNYQYHDSASIDLNNDGRKDISFCYHSEFTQPDCNCGFIDCCMPSGFSKCSLFSLTDIEIASANYIGIQPLRLMAGDTIDARLNWIKFSSGKVFAGWGMTNPWFTDNHDSFMAIRKTGKDTLYGWIRLNAFHGNKIELYDYVIEKIPVTGR